MQLSGNFERPNHFHAGFDLKHKKEGLCYIVADGYPELKYPLWQRDNLH
jgi:hypothetical protein